MRTIERRLTEWSRRELSDMDGQPDGELAGARANQNPYKIRFSVKRLREFQFAETAALVLRLRVHPATSPTPRLRVKSVLLFRSVPFSN